LFLASTIRQVRSLAFCTRQYALPGTIRAAPSKRLASCIIAIVALRPAMAVSRRDSLQRCKFGRVIRASRHRAQPARLVKSMSIRNVLVEKQFCVRVATGGSSRSDT
jgi:hypothetical protein